jgi:anaerobic selenocysteine-containing dehydrogenase
VPSIRQARQAGATIVLIDPRRTASADLADHHIVIRPATDGALALAMAHTIIATDRYDMKYIKKRVIGFERLREAIQGFTPEWASDITGIPLETIRSLAQMYSGKSPASIVIGYGLQRYCNGGNTVRSIDILGAITGNIGISGGGVNYANHFFPRFIGGDLKRSRARARNRRTFSIAQLAEYLESERKPPIQCIFVTKSNPLVQGPDINRTIEAFKSVGFKVVVDMFMTDTARHADIVLPCTSVLEEEDIIFSSMFSPYVNYSGQAVSPLGGILSDYDIYVALAERMGVSDFPSDGRRRFLERAIEPLTDAFGVSLSDLEQGPFSIPEDFIPWENGQFSTPSGKIELYSEEALADGHSPIATFIQPKTAHSDYPLRLLTPHRRASMHSQHFAFIDDIPEAVVRPETLRDFNLTEGARANVWSEKGEIIVKIRSDQGAAADAVTIDQGWWHKSGSVNKLISDQISEMGEQAAYYECFVNIAPAN